MKVTIRQMTNQDIEAVQNVAFESWHATYEGLIPPDVQRRFLEMAYSKDRLEKRLEKSPFYVAEGDEGIIGFANFSNVKEEGEVELAAIYLKPTEQGQGVGTKLLKQGLSELSPSKVFVNVESQNERGKYFYLAKGFLVVDEFEEDFDGHLLQTTRMVLAIP